MNYKLTFTILIFGQALLAQKLNGFYFEPLINVKTTVFTKKELPAPIITPYFQIKPQHLITPIGFKIGVNVGYRFKNNDRIQLGLFQDNSLSGYIFTGTEMYNYGTSSTSYFQNTNSLFDGVMTKNINLLYKRNLLTYTFKKSKKESYFDLHFNIGLTYFYKPNNGLENLTGMDAMTYYSQDSNKVTLETRTWVFPLPFKYSFKCNAGIEFTFGNKKSEWFTLGVSYITNISRSNFYSFTSSVITVTDKSNNTSTYTYYIKARGNGIYYQISRRFFPFKWKYERQQRKILEYKKNHT